MRGVLGAMALGVATLVACGARTELGVGDAGAEAAAIVAAPDAGAPDAGEEDGGGPPGSGPCFECKSPLVQECGFCLIQGFHTTYVCPIPHLAPADACQSLLEDHLTPKGAHFTCFYCP
jgi:hypothetical protein